ncbi:hypothetical protein WG66_008771, partial [Moniliophthora roreri]
SQTALPVFIVLICPLWYTDLLVQISNILPSPISKVALHARISTLFFMFQVEALGVGRETTAFTALLPEKLFTDLQECHLFAEAQVKSAGRVM